MEAREVGDSEEGAHAGERAVFVGASLECGEEGARVDEVDAVVGGEIGEFVLDAFDGGVEGLKVPILAVVLGMSRKKSRACALDVLIVIVKYKIKRPVGRMERDLVVYEFLDLGKTHVLARSKQIMLKTQT